MGKSGISRRIDELGRITIPMEMRRNLGIHSGDMIDISINEDSVVLSKSEDVTPKDKITGAKTLLDECSSLTDNLDAETAAYVKSKLAEAEELLSTILPKVES